MGTTRIDAGTEAMHVESPGIWLDERRVAVPGRVSGYLHRPSLVERCMPTERRLTLLQAPGGFGKTTVLAECCRVAGDRGVRTAWLSLDEHDDAATLEAYLVFAFQQAGLDALGAPRGSGGPTSDNRIALALRAVEAHARPCILVLDEAERVAGPAAALLNLLLRAGAPNLHLAISCRELPVGIDVATPMLQGEVEIVSADDLRFSREEIGLLFDGRLSRRSLATVTADSAGWPIALGMRRNAGKRAGDPREMVARGVLESWIDSRLWYGVADDDREFLLDVGLLEWIEAELLDEVLSGTGLMERLESLPAVAGLLEPVRGGAGNVWRLHPLVREYCVKRHRRETPARYRSIHGHIASAMARRGETLAAMRHAAEAANPALAGEILTSAGGALLFLREGTSRLIAIARFLTDETLALYPRLALVRVLALIVRTELVEARRVLQRIERAVAYSEANDDGELETELWIARGLLLQNGCASVGSADMVALFEALSRLAGRPGMDPVVRAVIGYGLCHVNELKAEFQMARRWGERARRWAGDQSPYLAMVMDYQFGQIAMAQGRIEEAARAYQRGLKSAKKRFLLDPRLAILGEALVHELEWERNRVLEDGDVAGPAPALWQRGAVFASYAAAGTVAAEIVLDRRGVESALEMIEEMWDNALRADLPALVRYLAGLRVAMLAEAGRVPEAESRWQEDALPGSPDECLDLASQSWREMELLSGARLRLLIARGRYDEGRQFVRRLVEVAASRGLRRTWMRALAQAMALEHAAGDGEVALQRLGEFLDLFAETDYARPMMREGDAAVNVLRAYLRREPEGSCRRSAESLLAMLAAGDADAVPTLTGRERQVLARLESESDKQIATALGLSIPGARYHVQRLFAKLRVRSRAAAVHRARALGLLV